MLSLGVQEGRDSEKLRKKTVDRLWRITEELNVLYKDNWTVLAAREIRNFQRELVVQGIKMEESRKNQARLPPVILFAK